MWAVSKLRFFGGPHYNFPSRVLPMMDQDFANLDNPPYRDCEDQHLGLIRFLGSLDYPENLEESRK